MDADTIIVKSITKSIQVSIHENHNKDKLT